MRLQCIPVRAQASIAKNHPFDCVLMDFHMPNMDGMGAMQAIRATHGAQAPVIFGFTADVLDNTAHAFAAGGAVAVLNKPYVSHAPTCVSDLCVALSSSSRGVVLPVFTKNACE